MIKVSVLYPAGEGTKFDMDYYCTSHIPMVRQKLGSACQSVAVEQGLGGGAPGSPPLYAAMGHLYFNSVAEFQAAFAPHADSDHRRRPELHKHSADHPNERGEDLIWPAGEKGLERSRRSCRRVAVRGGLLRGGRCRWRER